MAMPIALDTSSAAPARAPAQARRPPEPAPERPPPATAVAEPRPTDKRPNAVPKAAELPKEDPERGSPASYSAMAQLSKALERGDLDAVEQAFQALRLRRSSSDIGRPLINLIA